VFPCAVYLAADAEFTARDSLFELNGAVSNAPGGAISCVQCKTTALLACTFRNNSALYGGALHIAARMAEVPMMIRALLLTKRVLIFDPTTAGADRRGLPL
jgi:hypothetical protein